MKKSAAPTPLMASQDLLEPEVWGPILWTYLHILAERVGTSGNRVIDVDQANYMEHMITMLPLIVPCSGCQEHAADYLRSHPLPALQGLHGSTLTVAVRTWLFDFHTAVRMRLGQPVMVGTVEDCATLYMNMTLKKCEYTTFIQSVGGAVRVGKVRLVDWKKWYSYSERLRVISGNPVM